MVKRYDLPDIPDDFDSTKEIGMRAKSYHYIPCDEVSSAMQKSIRRCYFKESIQWCFSLLWSSPHRHTNVLNRLLIITLEDIGLAYRDMICFIYECICQYNDTGKEIYVGYAVEALVKAKKCRANDWICHVTPVLSAKDINKNGIVNVVKLLVDSIECKDYILAAQIANSIFMSSFSDDIKIPSKKEFDIIASNIPLVKYYNSNKGIQEYIWVAILSFNKYTHITHTCYKISHLNNFRWTGPAKLFYVHCILTLCIKKVGKDELSEPLEDTKELKDLIRRYKDRKEELIGIPDYALDKHTTRGSSMGRDMYHFIKHGAKLNNRDERYIKVDDDALKLRFS